MNLPDGDKTDTCFFCGVNTKYDPAPRDNELTSAASQEINASEGVLYCPWEDQDELGMFTGLYATLRASMFHPASFFSAMPRDTGFIHPLLFVMIVSTLGTMGSMIWGFFLDSPIYSNGKLGSGAALLIGLTLPLTIPVAAFVHSALLHMSLKLVTSAESDFQATFRVVCYSSGPDLFNLIIPALGPLVSLVWQIVISVMGLSIVHRISVARVILALVTLVFIAFIILSLAAFLFFIAAAQ
jgi:hypothetical protein